MATIVTRAGKGSELTYDEVDANFTNLNAQGLPAGGTTGQVLAKSSNADYAATWVNQSSSYTLPTASATALGGIKVGTGLSIDGAGFLSATGGGGGGSAYGNLDGGTPSSNYGGITAIDGGTP